MAVDDYDMDAWLLANNNTPLPKGEHYPDTYKKPNHITFSDESVYHGKDGAQGGKWIALPEDKFAFRPGPTNLEHHTTEDLINYFKKEEPGNYLLLGGEDAQ